MSNNLLPSEHLHAINAYLSTKLIDDEGLNHGELLKLNYRLGQIIKQLRAIEEQTEQQNMKKIRFEFRADDFPDFD